MINISKEEKERCKTDPLFLREKLEKELEHIKNMLLSSPLDKVLSLQGRASALQDVITMLPK
jgi:hypothetical protein